VNFASGEAHAALLDSSARLSCIKILFYCWGAGFGAVASAAINSFSSKFAASEVLQVAFACWAAYFVAAATLAVLSSLFALFASESAFQVVITTANSVTTTRRVEFHS